MKIAVGVLLILIALFWLIGTIRMGGLTRARLWGLILTIGSASVGIILLLGGSWLSILWGAAFASSLYAILHTLAPPWPLQRNRSSLVFLYLFAVALIIATILTWGIDS